MLLPSGSCISDLRVSYNRKSYTPLSEICSMFSIELFNLRMFWKKLPAKLGGILGALVCSLSTKCLYKCL